MRATILLADAAQAISGKLYILGGGWSITGPDPVPFSVAVKIEVPWDQANVSHDVRLELLDGDGRLVLLPHDPDAEPQPLVIDGAVEVGRPPKLLPGTPLDSVLAINFPTGLPLDPGHRYEWRLFINDETRHEWTVGFTTRPRPPSRGQ